MEMESNDLRDKSKKEKTHKSILSKFNFIHNTALLDKNNVKNNLIEDTHVNKNKVTQFVKSSEFYVQSITIP